MKQTVFLPEVLGTDVEPACYIMKTVRKTVEKASLENDIFGTKKNKLFPRSVTRYI